MKKNGNDASSQEGALFFCPPLSKFPISNIRFFPYQLDRPPHPPYNGKSKSQGGEAMTFQQLTYVVEIAKCGSINKAAHK